MSFNLKRAIEERNKPEKDGIRFPRKTKEEKEEEKIQVRKESSLFLIYIMKNYCSPSPETNTKDYNVRIWSKVDSRYVFNVYTNNTEKILEYILKQFKKKDSTILDIRYATQKELIEKYRMRFLD